MILFNFLHKQKEFEKQKKVTQILINNLKIPEEQKKLFLDALDILDEQSLNKLYNNLTEFIKEMELKELEDIKKSNFTKIA
jgi:predicted HAD superfamily phosphohydrolase